MACTGNSRVPCQSPAMSWLLYADAAIWGPETCGATDVCRPIAGTERIIQTPAIRSIWVEALILIVEIPSAARTARVNNMNERLLVNDGHKGISLGNIRAPSPR